eukprot:PRCOL_00004216-RA
MPLASAIGGAPRPAPRLAEKPGTTDALENWGGAHAAPQAKRTPVAARGANAKGARCVSAVDRIAAARDARREAAAAARAARAADEGKHGGAAGANRARTRKLVAVARDKALARPSVRAPASESMRAGEVGCSLRVVVRVRPLSEREASAEEQFEVITAPTPERGAADDERPPGRNVVVHEPRQRVDTSEYVDDTNFSFDGVLGPGHDNADAYELCVGPLLEPVASGAHCTVFAYGATGGGKTHTISSFHERCARELLALAATRGRSGEITVCAFEIYGQKVFDLLDARKAVRLCDDSNGEAQLLGLSEHRCDSLDQAMGLVDAAHQSRQVGITAANDHSSRSHAVVQLQIAGAGGGGGRLSLVDLAGAERGADNGSSDRRTRMEGAEINKSLLALKECVRALAGGCSGSSHVPFRGSRLTHVLRESFVSPNSRTVLLACVAPGCKSVEYTLNTLRYAERAGSIKVASGNAGERAADSSAQPAKGAPNAGRTSPPLEPPAAEPVERPVPRTPPPQPHLEAAQTPPEIAARAGTGAGAAAVPSGKAQKWATGAAPQRRAKPACSLALVKAHATFSELNGQMAEDEAALLVAASGGDITHDEYVEMLEFALGRRERAVEALRAALRRA